MYKLAYVYNNMYMFVDANEPKITDDTKCRVYNEDLEQFAPSICVGSWACRMGPWVKPSEQQLIKSKNILIQLVQEEEDGEH